MIKSIKILNVYARLHSTLLFIRLLSALLYLEGRSMTEQIIKMEEGLLEEPLKKFYCDICNKGFTRNADLKRHVNESKSHNRLTLDEFQFESFVTGHYHYRHIWTPQIGEELATVHEPDNAYDEFAVSILKTDTIVGHIPHQISKQCTALLKSGGSVKLRITANPVNTMTHGIRVPCTYSVNGKVPFVRDIKNNVVLLTSLARYPNNVLHY